MEEEKSKYTVKEDCAYAIEDRARKNAIPRKYLNISLY